MDRIRQRRFSEKKTKSMCNVIQIPVPLCKAKAIPLQAWTGPEGSGRLRLPDFKTIGT
jgi:hypothetical protein